MRNKERQANIAVLNLTGHNMSSFLDSLDCVGHTIILDLALLALLPDCPHAGKSLNAGFANWFLKLWNQIGNIAILKTVQNKSDPWTKQRPPKSYNCS